jgi:hypothetical protein
LKEKLERERAALVEKMNSALTVTFLKKGYQAANWQAGTFQDLINLSFGFENKGQKGIVGFKGAAHFVDIFGDEIKSINLSYDESLPVGKAVRWTGSVKFNQFMDDDKKLRAAADDKIKFTFVPQTIIFADGEKLEAPQD